MRTAGADYFITVRREAHSMRDAKRNGFGRASRNESVLTAWFNLKVKYIRKRSTHSDQELRWSHAIYLHESERRRNVCLNSRQSSSAR